MSEAEFLAQVSLFSMMKKRDLDRLAKLAQYRTYHKGDVVIREGERDGRLFVIISGEVEVVRNLGDNNETRVRALGPRSYFGEMALIDDLVRSASVVATQDTQVLSLEQLDLRREIENYPALAIELLQMLSRRIRAIEKSMVHTLGQYLPICTNCKKIRDADGSWRQIEEYIRDHSDTEFTHSICPECVRKLYPQLKRD